MALSSDGRLVASGASDGTIRLWDPGFGSAAGQSAESKQPLTTLQGHAGSVQSVALSADGRVLASGGADGVGRLWSLTGVAKRDGMPGIQEEAVSAQLLATLQGHTGVVLSVALSGDGRLMASGGDAMVRLWDTTNGASLRTLLVWEAEDGRCEACGRPLDKTCARTGRDKRGERRLVCPDCKERRPDPLAAAVVGPKTAGQLAEALGTTPEAASAWLAEGRRAAGVLLQEAGGQRTYWLPGVGHFALYVDRPGRPPLIGGPLHRELEIRVKPQARTRGLPRRRAPGMAPAQHTGEHP